MLLFSRLLILIFHLQYWFWLAVLASVTSIATYLATPGHAQSVPVCPSNDAASTGSIPDSLSLPSTASSDTLDLLQQSWLAYRDRFIQGDGRVIDREANDRTVSEGQAYAMLRAVMINDPDTFQRTLSWAESNLIRADESGDRTDSLWAWKWGRLSNGEWKTIDANFASDADLDAVVALILAARRWNCPAYLDLAQEKLEDLWELSTVEVKGDRYLLPGPQQVFGQEDGTVILNPSYLAPYAFRLFAQVDPRRDWLSLVDSSYRTLEESAALSEVGLPSDWVSLNLETGEFQPLPASNSLRTRYGFDAYRVWWRIAWDYAWFEDERAERYLKQRLAYLQDLWQTQQAIPAEIDLQGDALVDYEATSQYAMLYSAFQLIDPTIAEQIYRQKLMPQYRNGFWDSDSAYYTQNLAWFALVPWTASEDLVQDTGCANSFSLDQLKQFFHSLVASHL
ncbi:MAG: hypothetical protein Kow00121_25850 [Elainellaceae cyanobacterium]